MVNKKTGAFVYQKSVLGDRIAPAYSDADFHVKERPPFFNLAIIFRLGK
jgi:hypothetical protein